MLCASLSALDLLITTKTFEVEFEGEHVLDPSTNHVEVGSGLEVRPRSRSGSQVVEAAGFNALVAYSTVDRWRAILGYRFLRNQ